MAGMFGKCHLACAGAGLFLLVGVATGQNKSEDSQEVRIRDGTYRPRSPTIAVQSNLVELGVTIRDHKGQLVSGLSPADFEVLDNGKPQAVAFFSEEKANAASPKSPESEEETTLASGKAGQGSRVAPSDAPTPRYAALFIDDTHSELRALQTAKIAAEKFVETAFQPSDHIAIFTDSGAVTLDFTSKKEDLLAAIAKIKLQSQRQSEALSLCPSLTAYQGYVIANHLDSKAREVAEEEAVACNCAPPVEEMCRTAQAGLVEDLAAAVWNQNKNQSMTTLDVLKIAVQQLAKAPGKRVLIIVSPGFATRGMEQSTSGIIDAALRGHIVINALDSEGLLTTGESPEGSRVDEAVRNMVLPEMMSAAATATGGQFIRNNNDLTASLRELASMPEVSYLLGFAPANRPDNKYHQLKVRLKNDGAYRIQARDGYYAGGPEKEAETAQQQIDRLVAGKDQLEQILVAVHVSHGIAKDGQYPILVAIRIDAKQLKFAKQGGRNLQQLTFVSVLEDSEGNYVAGKQAVMDLMLTDKTLATYEATGIKVALTFTAPKGSYEVREVVRELVQNRMAASNTPVDCR
jgi:VWFA-related protein